MFYSPKDFRLFNYPKLRPEYLSEIYQTSVKVPPKLNSDSNPPEKGLPTWLLHLLAGGVSGPVSRTITAPIDRIRLTIQVNPKSVTVIETIQTLVKDAGISGLWRGNLVNIIKVTPEMSLRFAIYERLKQYIRVSQDKTSVYEKMLAGGIAGVFAQLTIYPLEVFKTRMTVRRSGQYNSMLDAVAQIYKNEGFMAFYRGYFTSAIGILPYTAIDLTVFEILKAKIVYTENYWEVPRFILFLKVMSCAAISTTCGQAASYPFYLIKARQQAASTHASMTIKNKWRFCKICQIIHAIVAMEGISGLYRGLLPSLVKVLPASAINYTVYEYMHRKLISKYGNH